MIVIFLYAYRALVWAVVELLARLVYFGGNNASLAGESDGASVGAFLA